jgi:tripartite-type tricarboxylate transporter receptor subunit TctC
MAIVPLRWIAAAGLLACPILLAPRPSEAQSPEQFYKGRSITLLVGAAPGGAYDLVARTVAAHWGRHIPGSPSFVVSTMDLASGLVMANHLYNAAKKDGTVMGLGNANIALEPRLKMLTRQGGTAAFDIRRFNWIGSPLQLPQVLWVFHTAPAQRFEDLRTTKTIMGSMGVGGDNFVVPWLMNQLLGTKMEIVSGYKSQSDIFIASERGEVHGNTAVLPNLTSAKADWWASKKLRVLVQASEKRIAALPDVPTTVELAGSPEDGEILRFWSLKYSMAYPIFMPPDVPADRVEAIRAAFDATMTDPLFLAEARRLGLDIDPFNGRRIQALIEEIQSAPQPLVDRVAQLMQPPADRR